MDAAEFKQQFLPYHRKLYRTAFRLTENPQEAEDMVGGSGKVVTKRNRFFYVINAGRRYFSPHGMGLSVTIINQMP